MSEKLTEQDVHKLATLARLKLSQDEVESFTASMQSIFMYIDSLNEIDLSEVKPVTHIQGLSNVFRPDEVDSCLSLEQLTNLAPEMEGRSIRVPLFINHNDD